MQMHTPAHDDVNVYRKLNQILWNIGILYYFFISLLVNDWFAHTRDSHISRFSCMNKDKNRTKTKDLLQRTIAVVAVAAAAAANIIHCHQQQMTIRNKRLPIKFAAYISCECVWAEKRRTAERQRDDVFWCSVRNSTIFGDCYYLLIWRVFHSILSLIMNHASLLLMHARTFHTFIEDSTLMAVNIVGGFTENLHAK